MATDIRQYLRRGDIVLIVLLAANILLFPVAAALCRQAELTPVTALSDSWRQFASEPWTLLTYMFGHGSLMHLGFNMLWLYCFARLYLLAGRGGGLAALYVGGGVAGGVAFMSLHSVFGAMPSTLIGSSASVVAVAVAVAVMMPDRSLSLPLFGDVRIKWIVIFVVLLFCLGLTSGNAGGNLAHLGGAMWGLGYAMVSKYAATAGKRSSRRIDAIIDKARTSGYDALTDIEKQSLFRNFNSRR